MYYSIEIVYKSKPNKYIRCGDEYIEGCIDEMCEEGEEIKFVYVRKEVTCEE